MHCEHFVQCLNEICQKNMIAPIPICMIVLPMIELGSSLVLGQIRVKTRALRFKHIEFVVEIGRPVPIPWDHIEFLFALGILPKIVTIVASISVGNEQMPLGYKYKLLL